MSKKWYTADYHLYHNNILKYCPNRPVNSIEEMHDMIVECANMKVKRGDDLFVLGDVSLRGDSEVFAILDRIQCTKHLVVGNHDHKKIIKWSGWESVSYYKEIKDQGQNIILSHYPFESWNKMVHGSIHLHGHRHGSRPPGRENDECPWGLRVDVGVDPFNLCPVSLEDLGPIWLAKGKLV